MNQRISFKIDMETIVTPRAIECCMPKGYINQKKKSRGPHARGKNMPCRKREGAQDEAIGWCFHCGILNSRATQDGTRDPNSGACTYDRETNQLLSPAAVLGHFGRANSLLQG